MARCVILDVCTAHFHILRMRLIFLILLNLGWCQPLEQAFLMFSLSRSSIYSQHIIFLVYPSHVLSLCEGVRVSYHSVPRSSRTYPEFIGNINNLARVTGIVSFYIDIHV